MKAVGKIFFTVLIYYFFIIYSQMGTEKKDIRYGQAWEREELVLAFDLYCRIPFQQTKASNPKVKKLALQLGRTPSSVARKLGNFGAFDPELSQKGISGLVHTSKRDKEIWDEFNNDWNGLVMEANRLRLSLAGREGSGSPMDILPPQGPSETTREVKMRVHQAFFREAVLSSYNETCCITGLRISYCLIASHVIPWSIDEGKRTNPTNGLCLSATFDRLFDKGLITISDGMLVEVSRKLLTLKDPIIQKHIIEFHGKRIILPLRFPPSPDSLEWHRRHVYQA